MRINEEYDLCADKFDFKLSASPYTCITIRFKRKRKGGCEYASKQKVLDSLAYIKAFKNLKYFSFSMHSEVLPKKASCLTTLDKFVNIINKMEFINV